MRGEESNRKNTYSSTLIRTRDICQHFLKSIRKDKQIPSTHLHMYVKSIDLNAIQLLRIGSLIRAI